MMWSRMTLPRPLRSARWKLGASIAEIGIEIDCPPPPVPSRVVPPPAMLEAAALEGTRL